MGLAKCNPPLNHLRRARDDEERVAVLLYLWVLMRLARILDGQVVQPELRLNARQQVIAGLEQTDPHNVTGLIRPLASFVDRDVGNTSAIRVYAGSNNSGLRRLVRKRLVLDARVHSFLSGTDRPTTQISCRWLHF